VWFVDWGNGPGVSSLDGEKVLTDIIRPLGTNWIALGVPCQMNAKTPELISCNVDNSLNDEELASTTDMAHSLGLRVALLLALSVDGVPGSWVANLNYGSNDQEWSIYFKAYAAKLSYYAKLAEQDKIDLLIIGGEQTKAQLQEKYWRSLISQVRTIYHGPITYEAVCQYFDSVNWWDAVDYIGINYYCWPLTNNSNSTYADIKNHDLDLLRMIKEGTNQWQKPIIFTEIGYASVAGAEKTAPWGTKPVHLDAQTQANLTRAFFDTVKEIGNDDHWFKGLFWYNYTSTPLMGGMGDISAVPHNKPAEAYLQAFFTNQPMKVDTPTVTPKVDDSQIISSYWLFDDKLENGVSIGPRAGQGKQSTIQDPLGERGSVIRVKNIELGEGLELDFNTFVELRDYDYIELYLYSPKYEPNLEMYYDDSERQPTDIYRPNDLTTRYLFIRNYIDHEPLLDYHWHRILVPIGPQFPQDRTDVKSQISAIYFLHWWLGEPEPITFYVDNVRLMKMKK
jgi:hypothetical protein